MSRTTSILRISTFLFSLLLPVYSLPITDNRIPEIAQEPIEITYQDYIERIPSTAPRIRVKRYSIEGSYWGVREISWKVARSSRSLGEAEVRRVLRRAFKVWEEHSELRFVYKPHGAVHIEILFADGDHGDGEAFDGRGKILAHAYFPRFGGDVHFDDAETWSPDKYGVGIDLYAVAVHEIGHSLGLKHSSERQAIMAPFYQTYKGDALHLHKDDIDALDKLYGPSGAVTGLGFSENKNRLPDICSYPNLDAMTRTGNGSIYAFQGEFFWKLKEGGGVLDGPLRIDQHWPFEGHIDAALTDTEGDTYVFKGSKYWLLGHDGKARYGYPRLISQGLVDTPDNIDAALVWHADDRPYFFKKNKYWRYSLKGMPRGFPRSLKSLSRMHVFDRIDASLRYSDEISYVFVGPNYYRLGGKRFPRILPSKSKSIAKDWFGCTDGNTPEH
ncbi:unnamed protein product, partial [Mesorhabditis belari]|uniref:Peptidase metallopeptidase domain-containing protein n=1 Tax=Mesorhabditis belari TaxID=2138241 RepID=A0AAF3FMI1_9BILA